MNIAFFEVSRPQEVYLASQLKEHNLRFFSSPLRESELAPLSDTDILSVFISSRIGEKELQVLANLRYITTRSTGADHIDIESCAQHGIALSNVPHYGENTVAEHTFALILSLSRNIHRAFLRTEKGDFTMVGLEGFDLRGKVLGVVGTGRIGVHVIKIAQGFGMHVVAFDAHPNQMLSEVMGFYYTSLPELLSTSDIVSLHLPLTSQTVHIIDRDALSSMKKEALLINTARGGLVDTRALVEALEKEEIAGAGLDVIEGEEILREEDVLLRSEDPPSQWPPQALALIEREDVMLSPHIGFYSREAVQRILSETVKNIKAFANGEVRNEVTSQ